MTFSISNYTAEAITGELVCTLRAAGGESIRRFPVEDLKPGELRKIGVVSQTLPDPAAPSDVTIDAVLTNSAGAALQTNRWSGKICPSADSVVPEGKKVYASDDVLDIFGGSGMEPIPALETLPSDAVYVTGYIEPRLADALARGAGLVVLEESPSNPPQERAGWWLWDQDDGHPFDGVKIEYKQTWWKGGEEEDKNHVGTFVYDTPLTRELAAGSWCGPEWYYLLTGATKYYLDKMPSRPRVHIRALPSLVRVQDTAILFDASVGRGTLVVSGLNHFAAKGRPENSAVLRAMIRCAAEEKPAVRWPPEAIAPKAALPEGTVLGFVRTIPSRFETAIWKSWKSDNARNHVCRQTSRDNILSWLSAPVASEQENVTFVFAGGIGFRDDPDAGGFALEVNDREVLRFNLPPVGALPEAEGHTSTCQWTGAFGAALSLEILRFNGQDAFGRFRLTVPKELLSGKNFGEKISVRSLGEGSRRWFSVVPMFDLTD